jgi:LPXTG-motif cell wall-anchored protein
MRTSRALATVSIALAALGGACALAAAATPGSPAAKSGGALAEPMIEQHGGGHVAPARGSKPDAKASVAPEPAGGAEAPPAEAAQEEQPTSPGGEPQDGGDGPPEEPAEPIEPRSGEDGGGTSGDLAPVTGGLPSTGFELSAMALVGLGLLLLGAALRPRRSMPAGRR